MYKLSNLAAEDFAAIYEYTLLNFGALQADIYTDDLDKTFQLLSGSPLMVHECPEMAVGVRLTNSPPQTEYAPSEYPPHPIPGAIADHQRTYGA
jgi:plasmid stabilization system protein ParE